MSQSDEQQELAPNSDNNTGNTGDSQSGEACEDWGSGSNAGANNSSNEWAGREWRNSGNSDSRRGFRGSGRGRGRGGGFGFSNDRRRDDNDSRSSENRFDNYDSNRRPRGDFPRDGSDKSTFRIPSSDVGRVIGRGGATIKDLQSNSGARIKVNSNRDSYESDTLVELFGSEEQRDRAKELIMEIVDSPSTKPFKRQERYQSSDY